MYPRFHVLALREVRLMTTGTQAARLRRQARAQREARKQKEEVFHSPRVVLAALGVFSADAEARHGVHAQVAIKRSVALAIAQRATGVRQ